MRLAIFNTESEALAYSDKVHQYLLANRPGYNANIWAIPSISADGLSWSVKQPPEEIEQKWQVPINSTQELSNAKLSLDLPSTGTILAGEYYLYKGEIVKCRQTHQRTIYEPKDTPALFSFFHNNSGLLQWMPQEEVMTGWVRIYNNIKYEVIQAHQTQPDWIPTLTLGVLWKVYADPTLKAEWQIGISYKVGDEVTYQGGTYRCRQSHNSISTWTPIAAVSLWLKL